MEFKKYSKDNNISYSFGAFPTYELLQNKLEFVKAIVIHEKLEASEDIDKIITLAKNKKIPKESYLVFNTKKNSCAYFYIFKYFVCICRR